MCVLKIVKIFCFVNLFVKVSNLEMLPKQNNTISISESVIRNVTNQIFVDLKLRGIRNYPKLRQYSMIHNFFISLTLRDQHTLETIARLSKFEQCNRSNKTQDYVNIINELLYNDLNDDAISTIDCVDFMNKFLSNNILKVNGGYDFGTLNFDKLANVYQSDDFELQHRIESENYIVFSDNDFWEPEESGRRVYRGKRTKRKYFPFMASIQIFKSFQCGGSIIASDLVITAALCLQLAYNNRFYRENPSFLSVRVGSTFYQGGGEIIDVLEVYFHPSYDPKSLRNNLCVLRLVRQINFKKKYVKKIKLDRKASRLPENVEGITIVGWGARTTSNKIGEPWSNRMAYDTLDYYPYRDCQDIYSKEYVTERNFCAGFLSRGSGACNKDAGDPGVVDGILVGVVSFGSPLCGAPDSPTVFTKVGFYTDWIDEIMDQEVPHKKRRTTTQAPYDTSKYWNTNKKTTFTLVPVVDVTIEALPIHEVDVLRNLKNIDKEELQHVLTEILREREIDNEISDLRDQILQPKTKIKKPAMRMREEIIKTTTTATVTAPQIPSFRTTLEPTTELYDDIRSLPKRFTVLEDNYSADHNKNTHKDDLKENNVKNKKAQKHNISDDNFNSVKHDKEVPKIDKVKHKITHKITVSDKKLKFDVDITEPEDYVEKNTDNYKKSPLKYTVFDKNLIFTEDKLRNHNQGTMFRQNSQDSLSISSQPELTSDQSERGLSIEVQRAIMQEKDEVHNMGDAILLLLLNNDELSILEQENSEELEKGLSIAVDEVVNELPDKELDYMLYYGMDNDIPRDKKENI